MYFVPCWTTHSFQAKPCLYHEVFPVQLGLNLPLLQHVKSHPELQTVLQCIKNYPWETIIQAVLTVLEKVQDVGQHSWWNAVLQLDFLI